MHPIPLLRDLVILVAVAIPVVLVAHRLRAPTVVGFLLTGIAIGPHGLGLIKQPDSVNALAEVGVVLLLFAVGLELSVSRVMRLGREVVVGGGLQMAGTTAAVGGVLALAGAPLRLALVGGTLVALSSTAIVLRVFADRDELDTPHGRVTLGILLFQDLCVVPLMLFLPLLGGGGPGLGASLRSVGLSLAVVAGLVVFGRVIVPRVLQRVVALANRELFTLCVVFLGLGAAFVTSSFGLSLALGAFLAGLVIAESEYGLQALSDVLPFRDTFGGIFFTAVGMLLDPGVVVLHPALVLGATAGLIVVKTIVAAGAVLVLGRTVIVGIESGLGLAQIGEFSFVVAGGALALGILDASGFQLFLAAAVLSMLAAPFLIRGARGAALAVQRALGVRAHGVHTTELPVAEARSDHVIIVGYGLNGRNLARALRGAGIPYVVLEENGQTVSRARAEGEPLHFGDGTRAEVLDRVGISRARVIVFAIAAHPTERRGVAVARSLNPKVHIVVRTRYVAAIDDLVRLGADDVVPEEFETSVEIFASVLRRYGVPPGLIRREADAVRRGHYAAFTRGRIAAGARLDDALPAGVAVDIETVAVGAYARAVGENNATLRLRSTTGATVLAVIRAGDVRYTPDPAFRYAPGDVVVLAGSADALERGAALFRAAPPAAAGPPG